MVPFTSGRLSWMPAAASARQPAAAAETSPGRVSAVNSGDRASMRIRWPISPFIATHLQLHLDVRICWVARSGLLLIGVSVGSPARLSGSGWVLVVLRPDNGDRSNLEGILACPPPTHLACPR